MTRKIIITVLAALIIAGAAVAFSIYRMFTTPVSVCADYRIYITPADTQESVLTKILEADSTASTRALKYLLLMPLPAR